MGQRVAVLGTGAALLSSELIKGVVAEHGQEKVTLTRKCRTRRYGLEGTVFMPYEPYVRPLPKVGRNAPCPCGSGRKFKHCCMEA